MLYNEPMTNQQLNDLFIDSIAINRHMVASMIFDDYVLDDNIAPVDAEILAEIEAAKII